MKKSARNATKLSCTCTETVALGGGRTNGILARIELAIRRRFELLLEQRRMLHKGGHVPLAHHAAHAAQQAAAEEVFRARRGAAEVEERLGEHLQRTRP